MFEHLQVIPPWLVAVLALCLIVAGIGLVELVGRALHVAPRSPLTEV